MSKHIVLLSDGTGNSSAKVVKTNVWRLYQALDLSATNQSNSRVPVQVVCYDDGVGTSSFLPLAILGGAFGWGLKRNVLDLYCFLCRNYEPGDQIYCFGFSRGAFTIRVLVGMVTSQGLVPATGLTEDRLRGLATRRYREFRRRFAHEDMIVNAFRQVRDAVLSIWNDAEVRDGSHKDIPPIHFVGLWDTVAAYGLPIDELTRAWDKVFPLSAPDRNLSKHVKRACHALAIDDERQSFHPVLWNEADPSDSQRITQVWFSGMHANVGGGYPDDALAHVSLDWMMTEAASAGLVFLPTERDKVRASLDLNGKLYDSRSGMGGVYRYQPRDLALLCNDRVHEDNQVIVELPKIHHSVMQRIALDVDGYAPLGLPIRYVVIGPDGKPIDQKNGDPSGRTLIETEVAATARRHREECVRDLAWQKRLVYFLSVVVALSLLVFPVWHHDSAACEGKSCWAAPFINAIEMVVPGALFPWIDAFKTHPAALGTHVALIALLIMKGSQLGSKIKGRMRGIWDEEKTEGEAGFVRWLRTSGWYQGFMAFTRVWVMPWLASLAVLWLLFAGISQGVFSILNSGGFICPATSIPSEEHFVTSRICWNSDKIAQRGTRYRVTLSLGEGGWTDRGVPAGLSGVLSSDVTGLMHFFTLFKRDIHQPWFRPILRIGAEGADEYPLIGELQEGDRVLIAEVTARRSGPVYLFVNDAVLPGPASWQGFYGNNDGTGTFKFEELGHTSH